MMTEENHSGNGPDDVCNTTEFEYSHDWSEVAPSTAVVRALETTLERNQERIGPLYEAVDLEAMDSILRRDGRKTPDGGVTVSFDFGECTVTARSDGELTVHLNDTDVSTDGE